MHPSAHTPAPGRGARTTRHGQLPRDPHLLHLGADGAGEPPSSTLLRIADAKRPPAGSTSRLDAEPEEKKRNFTLSLHPEASRRAAAFHVLDCPGFAAFLTEVEWALQVTEGAVLAVSAADGAHNRAERTYDVLADSGRPAIASSRLDHEQADFEKTLADLEASLKVKPVPAPHHGRRQVCRAGGPRVDEGTCDGKNEVSGR